MYEYALQCLLISKKQVTDTNPLLDLATIPRDLEATSPARRNVHPHRRVSPDPLYHLLFYHQISIFWHYIAKI